MAEQTPATERPVDELTYEAARDELVSIVSRLETGQLPLEESLRVWERGEALAAHCASFLDRAEAHLAAQDAEATADQG